MEFEMKRTKHELEMHNFEEKWAFNLEYKRETHDIKNSDDGSDPSIGSRSAFRWKEARCRDVSSRLEWSDKPAKTQNNNCYRSKNGVLNT